MARRARQVNLCVVAFIAALLCTITFGWIGLLVALLFAFLLGVADAMEGDE